MTRIDFYQLDSDEAPLLFTCRLIEKIWRRGHQVFVYTASAGQTHELDDLLWTFRSDRFIPHVAEARDAPVQIDHQGEPAHQDVLVNLSNRIPGFFSRFDRVAEVVPVDQNSRNAARDNYRFYKDRGYLLHYHPITGSKH